MDSMFGAFVLLGLAAFVFLQALKIKRDTDKVRQAMQESDERIKKLVRENAETHKDIMETLVKKRER